jgi:hypothetical protein
MEGERTGRIDEATFGGLLPAAGLQMAVGEPILAAAVAAVPRSLRGENHPEGMLAALALELARIRRRFEVDEEDGLALSVKFRHEQGNEFDCDVAASEDCNMTI